MKDWELILLLIWTGLSLVIGFLWGVHNIKEDLNTYMNRAVILERCIWNGDMYKIEKVMEGRK